MNLLEKIARSACTKIDVHICVSSFTFISHKGTFDLKTCLYIEKVDGESTIAGIGAAPANADKLLRVDLFNKESHSDKYACLKLFIKHGLSLTTNKRALIRPEIRCTGWQHMTDYFSGYEQGILLDLFIQAGALDVVFE